jgi:CHAT domain-containing protein
MEQANTSSAVASEWQRVLFAGDPLGAADSKPALPSAGKELEHLVPLFDGKSVVTRSGKRLGAGLFEDPAFHSADLIHLASHSQINLEYPELSKLDVSTTDSHGGLGYLTPMDLRGRQLSANLVVLSACETTGVNRFAFDSNLGFVQAFLNAGSNSVVAALWPVSDAFAADFMLDFYANMLDGDEPFQALARAKRRYMEEVSSDDGLAWASFQIYLN